MIKRAALVLLVLAIWTATVISGALFGWWRRPIAPREDVRAFIEVATRRFGTENKGNTALVLIESGKIAGEFYSTRADTVDSNTVFATASMSKWIAAHAVMKLVEQGKLDLDRPVDRYLTRWHLPTGQYSNDGVTARRLLSHTAGLADGLGFGDYRLDESLPTLEQSLAAPRRSAAGATSPVAVGIEPGSEFRYSGGGYLLLELLVEEISGEAFESFVTGEILQPLGMARSGYSDLSSVSNSAKSYSLGGTAAPISKYASRAATGFNTSPSDLTRMVLAELQAGEISPLSPQTIASMRKAEARTMGVGLWGLGTLLYAPTEHGDVVFGHDGVNDPAISSTVRINPDTRDAIIVLATGSKAIASELGAAWVLWQTGLPDVLSVPAEVKRVMPVLAVGAVVILLMGFLRRRGTVT
jgi:CubicO group peptidase (beta-lactamase class C family)